MLRKREAALPGEMGGYRTFRDVRVVGKSRCPDRCLGDEGVGFLCDFFGMMMMMMMMMLVVALAMAMAGMDALSPTIIEVERDNFGG